MTKKKRHVLIATGAVALAAVLAVAVYAFVGRTSSADTLNTITTGLINIKLHERDGATEHVADQEDVIGMNVSGVLPGQSQTKTLYVENADTESAWVRVKVEKAFMQGGTEVTTVTLPTETREYDPANDKWNVTSGTETKTLDPDLVDVSLDPDTASNSNWIDNGGYFYFKPVLTGTTNTPNLVLQVSFSGDMGNEYEGLDVKVNVSAEAVQYRNNASNNDVMQVQGWPEPATGT